MGAVLINFLAVVVGGVIGTLMHGGIPQKLRTVITQGLALCVLVIGITGAIATKNILIVIISIVVGTAAGELVGIERGLDRLGNWVRGKFSGAQGGFTEGFVNATLLFSVGAMAVVGSLDAGLSGKMDTLLAKSVIDGVSAVIFASSFGAGVVLAAIPMSLYQGAIALLAGYVAPLLTDVLIAEVSAVGSILIIGLSLNMLEIGKERIRVGNMLPAMLVPLIYYPLADWLQTIIR